MQSGRAKSSLKVFRRFKSTAKKPLFITTPIFYPNASPHLGHLHSMVMCDFRHRWEKLKEKESFLLTGTDEHGLKIQTAAEKQNKDPKAFVDELAKRFKDLADMAEIDYSRFIRTTDEDHIQAVQHLWNVLLEKKYIYKGEHDGWYSVVDETFYTDKQIHLSADGKYYSTETGAEVTYSSETNYFFKLSKFQDDLLKHLEDHPTFILPRSRQKEVMKELQTNKLQDLSISRPAKRLSWGIPVPNDESQTIYVWIDALTNYLTAGGYPNNLSEDWYPTHIIGKDIIRFHCVYWPAMLMAAELPLPKQIVVHGHWLAEGSKMSKSKGNVVDPIEISNYYGVENVRFFLAENSSLENDSDFSEEKVFKSASQLVNKLGNLIQRCTAAKFDLRRGIENYDKMDFSKMDPRSVEQHKKLKKMINELLPKYDSRMTEFNTSAATVGLWNLLGEANYFVNATEPWTLEPGDEQDLIIYTAMEAARVATIVLQPFIPQTCDKAFMKMGCIYRSLNYARFGADKVYGTKDPHSKGPLFERIKKRT